MNGREKNNIIYIKCLYVSFGNLFVPQTTKRKNKVLRYSLLSKCECALMKITVQFDYAVDDGAMEKMLRFFLCICSSWPRMKMFFAPALAFFSSWREKKEKKLFFFSVQFLYTLCGVMWFNFVCFHILNGVLFRKRTMLPKKKLEKEYKISTRWNELP